jgi:hypothetical protein
MTSSISVLIELAKSVRMSAGEKEEQRRSFAYGNTAIENRRITRSLIDEQAEKLQRESESA